jgi:outer membrane protein TolC
LAGAATADDAVSDGNLTLWEALDIANRQNERLSIEGENYLQAIIEKRRVLATLLPQLSLSPSYFRGERTGGLQPPENAELALQADWAFNPVRDLARLGAGDFSIEQRRQLLLDQQEALLIDTVVAYYAVLRADALVGVLTVTEEAQSARAREARRRLEVGLGRELDVAFAESQLGATRVSLVEARAASVNSRSALEYLIGVPVAGLQLTDGHDMAGEATDREAWRGTATVHRRDLKAAEAAVEAARTSVETAFAQYYPSVSMDLDGFLSSRALPTDREWEGFIRLHIPLFTAGRIHQEVRAAWSRHRQAVFALSLLRRGVARDIDQAIGNLQASRERVTELEAHAAAARMAARLSARSLASGLGSAIEDLEAQETLLEAERGLADALLGVKVSRLELHRAAGTLRGVLEKSR